MSLDTALRRGAGPAAAAMAAGLLLLLGLLIVVFNEAAYDAQKTREAGVQAQIISASVAPALLFMDDASAQDYLTALSANPSVGAAGVYNAARARIASYTRAGALAPPAQVELAAAHFEGRSIVAVIEVSREGESLGFVYLRTDAETAFQRFSRYAGVGVLVLLAALVLAAFGLAHGALKRANDELAARAAELQLEIEHRERAEEELLQSRKMEAIGQLVGGVAHDFNNLLTVVLSGLKLMERNSDPARRAATVEAMRQAVERGAGLTRQLLAFARRQTLKPEVIDVGGRLSSMRELLERSLRADILIDIRIASGLWPVKTDPTQFELAILNLAVNARDAMPKGGVLTLAAENLIDAGGDYVVLRVTDTGVGMSEEVRKRVFEPYFTTKQAGQGTGLGLAQVYGIVTQSGGVVTVESAVNAGTTVTLRLPRSEETPAVQLAPTFEKAGGGLLGKRLLVVEDDDAVAGVVDALAREAGCVPFRAADAETALNLLNEGKRFDLVFSDIIMPGAMNGFELALEIERHYPALPIVLTTGYSGAAEVGARFPVLRKPYEPEEFERLLESVLVERAAKSA